ncbi:hypothetical protein CC2G_003458 [Coprinopsis cinerea AmutBmut pab1-1]|nr:hypothetical protein CC2G_003458 [Coprinopsis cinerea AmutBmut pab1-1]
MRGSSNARGVVQIRDESLLEFDLILPRRRRLQTKLSISLRWVDNVVESLTMDPRPVNPSLKHS